MNRRFTCRIALIASLALLCTSTRAQNATNPILWADVPDPAMIRVGDTYYMSSTTMHMAPGLPIMKSNDLVNWQILNYAYETLSDNDALNLANGRSSYGQGSWASSLRFHDGVYYATTFSSTTGRTHIYRTSDIENQPWQANSFAPSLHDASLFFDDDGRVYMLWGAGDIRLVELEKDLSGLKPGGINKVVITNASLPAGSDIMLPAEGSQLFKVDGKYYVFNIVWPRGGMRTVIVHRADRIDGPYEGRLAFQDQGVAQGGLIDTPDGRWFAYLFQDHGAVGRVPYLVPVVWKDGWPVLGEDGKLPATLDLPVSRGLTPSLLASDEFERASGQADLPLAWQWNHNPDNDHWSLTDRRGYLRLSTSRIDASLLAARNMLTQRTIGPSCVGTISIDVSALKDGDHAGLCLLQQQYGLVGVQVDGDTKFLVMAKANPQQRGRRAPRTDIHDAPSIVVEKIAFEGDVVFLRAECDFRDRLDKAHFYYSVDGTSWTAIGEELQMRYTLPHFMGYRFGLFTYSTKHPGGHADFDFFRVSSRLKPSESTADNSADQP